MPDQQGALPPHATAAAPGKTVSTRGCVIAFAALAAVITLVLWLLPGGSTPPTPLQACVSSIKAEPAGQVIGFTPACLRLPLDERNAAIRQATG